jgi:hypothetical protein
MGVGKKICGENISFYKNAGKVYAGKVYAGKVYAVK